MRSRIVSLCVALVCLAVTITPASAQNTITLLFDDPVTGLQRFGDVQLGMPFEIVAYMEADKPSCAAEFVMTEFTREVPGVFKLATFKVNNTPLDLGDNSVGEYIMAFNGCVHLGPVELVRIMYADFTGVTPQDVVLGLRGLQPGDSFPSSFEGKIGYIDWFDVKRILTPVPWSEFGMPEDPGRAGALVLNPTLDPVANEVGSMGALKTRF
jgi:hypothetical protein